MCKTCGKTVDMEDVKIGRYICSDIFLNQTVGPTQFIELTWSVDFFTPIDVNKKG